MRTDRLTPIILWDGDEEIVSSQEHVMEGGFDTTLVPLLETTAVYRDLLLKDPEGKQLADPIQQRLVDRGYHSLTERLVRVEEPLTAILRISQINFMLEQCRN